MEEMVSQESQVVEDVTGQNENVHVLDISDEERQLLAGPLLDENNDTFYNGIRVNLTSRQGGG